MSRPYWAGSGVESDRGRNVVLRGDGSTWSIGEMAGATVHTHRAARGDGMLYTYSADGASGVVRLS